MTHGDYILGTSGDRGYLRIATEEAFCPPDIMTRFLKILEDKTIDDPGFYSLWGFYGGDSERAKLLRQRIQDLGELRISDMDSHGIDMQILSITCPGVQMFSPAEGSQLAIETNDGLHDAIQAYPQRFTGLATIAPQDPDNAAKEIQRCVSKLDLKYCQLSCSEPLSG